MRQFKVYGSKKPFETYKGMRVEFLDETSGYAIYDKKGKLKDFGFKTKEDAFKEIDNVYSKIYSTTEASTDIKAYEFADNEDGWGEDIEDILSRVFAMAEDLMYEVRNAVRGSMTDCKTPNELADHIRELASEFEEAANEIDSL